jgi:hypothetical protein
LCGVVVQPAASAGTITPFQGALATALCMGRKRRTTMSQKIVAALILTSLSCASSALLNASVLTSMQESLVTQGTVPDGDFFMLTRFTSFEPGNTLRFQSRSDGLNWDALLSGSYLGTDVDVSYEARRSSASAPLTWTSSGFYGADEWTGSGSISIADAPGGFVVNLTSTLEVGSDTGSVNATIQAMFDGSAIEYGGTTGSMSINGAGLGTGFGYTLHMKISEGVYINDFDILKGVGSGPLTPVLISIFPTFPNTSGGGLCGGSSVSCEIDGTLTTVPEPGTVSQLLVVGAAPAMWGLVRFLTRTRAISA